MTQAQAMEQRQAEYLAWRAVFIGSYGHWPTHAEYLASAYWQERRQDILDTRGHHCEKCQAPGRRGVKLDVHHKTYEHKGCELDSELVILCYRCHMKAERKKRKGGQSGNDRNIQKPV